MAVGLRERGVALWRAGQPERAAAALARAVAEQPADADAWRHLAAAQWQAGQPQAALRALTEALLHDPGDPVTWLHLGRALLADDQPEAAWYALAEAALRGADTGVPRQQAEAALGGPPTPHLAHTLMESPSERLRAELDALGVAALGVLQRAEPVAPEQVRWLVGALGRLSPALGRQALQRWSTSEQDTLRSAAAAVVVELAAQAPAPFEALFAQVLADDHRAVRETVVDALTPRLTATTDVALWERVLSAPDTPLAEHACRLLTEGHGPTGEAGEQWLEGLLLATEERLRDAAAACYAARGDDAALQRIFADGSPAQRKSALRGFHRLAAVDLLALGLWDDIARLRAEAACLLGELADPEARAPLTERLGIEDDPLVQEALHAALSALPEPMEATETAGGNEPTGDASETTDVGEGTDLVIDPDRTASGEAE